MRRSELLPLNPAAGRVRKPAPVALSALAGQTSDDCERALRKYQDGRSVRGTPSTAIVPAGHDLGLHLEPVFEQGSGPRLRMLIARRGFHHPLLVELGGGSSQKPHYLALAFVPGPGGFDALHVVDVFNSSPTPFAERAGNPGRCGDGRKVHNAWRVLEPKQIERFRSDIVRVVAEPHGIAIFEAPPLYAHSIEIVAPQIKRALAGETVVVAGCGPSSVDLMSHPGEEKPWDFSSCGYMWQAEKARCGLVARVVGGKHIAAGKQDGAQRIVLDQRRHLMAVGIGSQATSLWRTLIGSRTKPPSCPWYTIREPPNEWSPDWLRDFLQCVALYWIMHEAPEHHRPKHSVRSVLDTCGHLPDWYATPRLLVSM